MGLKSRSQRRGAVDGRNGIDANKRKGKRAVRAAVEFPPAPFAPVLAHNNGKTPYSRRMLWTIAPETGAPDLFTLSFSGEDKYVIGQGNGSANGEQPRKVWNDETGAHRSQIVARNLTRAQADTIVAQIGDWARHFRFDAPTRMAQVTDPLAQQTLNALRSAFPDSEVCTKNYASLDARRASMTGEKSATRARIEKTVTASPTDALLAIARAQAGGDEKRAKTIFGALLKSAGLNAPAAPAPVATGKGGKRK
jgi:hypothetical protein